MRPPPGAARAESGPLFPLPSPRGAHGRPHRQRRRRYTTPSPPGARWRPLVLRSGGRGGCDGRPRGMRHGTSLGRPPPRARRADLGHRRCGSGSPRRSRARDRHQRPSGGQHTGRRRRGIAAVAAAKRQRDLRMVSDRSRGAVHRRLALPCTASAGRGPGARVGLAAAARHLRRRYLRDGLRTSPRSTSDGARGEPVKDVGGFRRRPCRRSGGDGSGRLRL